MNMSLPVFLLVPWLLTEAALNSDLRGQGGVPLQTFQSVSVNPADFLTPCLSLLLQAHGLPCPPALDTWKSTIEQRAVDMMCHLYKPNKRSRQHTQLILFLDLNSLWVTLPAIFHRETLQLSVGPLLHMMLNNIEEKVQGTSSQPNRLEH